MTASENVSLTSPDPLRCPVCPHRVADHDAIAERFCSATLASGSAHGCVCRPGG